MEKNESTNQPPDDKSSEHASKSQTLRIFLDSARPPDAPIEPKKATTARVPASALHPGPIPQTIRLKRPPTSPITLHPADLSAPAKKSGHTALVQIPSAARPSTAETIKRQTTRTEVAGSTAPKAPPEGKRATGPILGIPMHAGPIPQTIRLKRPPTSPVIRPPTATVVAKPPEPAAGQPEDQVITEAPTVVKRLVTPKTSTSRIVVEAQAAPVSTTAATVAKIPSRAAGEQPPPKTIRLKQPAGLSEIEESVQVKVAEETNKAIKKGETSKIEFPFEEGALAPITQRKTIKIKRTDHAAPPQPPAAPAEVVAAPEAIAPVKAAVPEEEHGPVYSIVAAAATLCIAALVYIMVAQAFGVHLPLPASWQIH